MFTKAISKIREADDNASKVLVSLALPAALTGAALLFAIHALFVGHDHVLGTSREVPWGMLIAPYAFFACLATGFSLLSSLGQVFAISPLVPFVRRLVFLAIIAMATALFAIGLEVESPWRVGIYGILSANPLSNIWWKSTLYTLFLLLMCANYALLLIDREKVARGLGLAALIAITAGNLNLKADIALLGARSFWAENYMPLFFLIVSILLACSVFALVNVIGRWVHGYDSRNAPAASLALVHKIFTAAVLVLAAFVTMKILNGLSPESSANPEAMNLLVKGDYALNFWIGEVGLAIVLPLFFLVLSKSASHAKLFAMAGLSAIVGIFITFYDIVIVGQLVPHYADYNLFGYPELYSYAPTLHEYIIAAGSFGLFLSLFIIGEYFFKNSAA